TREEIGEMIRKTRFGELVITIHDAKIVQIEKKEKKRFNYELPHRWCESKKI
ncbi:MAG: YezD family protein, partial [Candidatus Omnitrophica bacterium]|nr:YezD family protein [Candidatus Omnitrophota bacterium]